MDQELLTQLSSLGISGLLFVMWWLERQDRQRASAGLRDAAETGEQVSGLTSRVIEVIRANTEALTELRDELRSQHECETQWRMQLIKQLEHSNLRRTG